MPGGAPSASAWLRLRCGAGSARRNEDMDDAFAGYHPALNFFFFNFDMQMYCFYLI